MHFREIIEFIVERVTAKSKFTNNEIRKILMKSRAANKHDFCMFLNQISTSPAEDAKELYETLLSQNIEILTDITCKDSVISFNLNKEKFYIYILLLINKENDNFGKNTLGNGKTVVIDFSSPNIAKIFHVGHFRTTVLENFITNLLRTSGYKVVAMNYLGDWGKQFGLVLLAFEKYGDMEKLKTDPLVHLYDLNVRINNEAKSDPEINNKARHIFKEMEENHNENYMSKWKMFRELSIEKYKKLYKMLNIEFDVYSGESIYNEKAKDFPSKTKICSKDADGSYTIDCGSMGKALVQKSDGTTLYLARYIIAAIERIETYSATELLYVVADEQNMHFKQLFECLHQLGYDRSMFKHVNYGLIKGMSTRNGQVHFLEDVITTSARIVKENILSNPDKEIKIENQEETALNLAVSTLLIADFGAKRIKGYTFDIEKPANCENGSGAYLQYAHCRLKSIETKNSDLDLTDLSLIDFECLNQTDVFELVYKLIWYEQIVELCVEDFEPSRIVLYLMDLARTTNNLIMKFRVKGEKESIAKARLVLFIAARIVFKNELEILGIKPLDKM